MIPEDEDAVVGFVLLTVADKVRQSVNVAHVGISQRFEPLKTVAVVQVAFNGVAFDFVVLPLLRAARFDDEFDVGRELDLHDFLNIGGCGTVIRLQIRAAQVPLNNPGVVGFVGVVETCRCRFCRAARRFFVA